MPLQPRTLGAVAVGSTWSGASVIQCCYAAIERRESSTSTPTRNSKNANVTFRRGKKSTIHAGDIGCPEVLEALRLVAPVTAVRVCPSHSRAALDSNQHLLDVMDVARHQSSVLKLLSFYGGIP